MRLTLTGQIPSGKNAVVVTRTGHRFPNKRFVEWRSKALEELSEQLKGVAHALPLDCSCNVTIQYYSADNIRNESGDDEIVFIAGVNTDFEYGRDKGLEVTFEECVPVSLLSKAQVDVIIAEMLDSI